MLNTEASHVRLRFREKQSFYHSLGQLLRSGATFPAALESLGRTSRGSLRQLLNQLNRSVSGGHTVAEAFAAQRPAVSELEAGIVAAVERAGRLDHGLAQLAEYFGALDAARSGVLRKIAYPVFVLHFGILVLGLPKLLMEGPSAYIVETGMIFAILYGAALLCFLALPVLRDAGATSATADAILRRLPVAGPLRRDFAVARFCATYEMQLGAGVNVMDGLTLAARASRSALISSAVNNALPEVRSGAQVGPLLAVSNAFPEPMIRSFCVGEESGNLGQELDRLAADYQRSAIAKLDVLADWLPKLIYMGICAYLGYRIVAWYSDYLQQVIKLTE